MKTQEEIEQLAEKEYPIEMVAIFTERDKVDKNKERRKIFIETYTQCQQDMADKETQDKIKEHILNHARKQTTEDILETELAAKKYTLEDIENAFNSGRGYGVPDNIKDFNSFINSLNKQDNEN
jgi:replicative DNA helicase